MNRFLLAGIAVVGLCSVAHADNGNPVSPIGNWKMKDIECSSGVAAKSGSDSNYISSVSATLKVSSSDVDYSTSQSLSMTQAGIAMSVISLQSELTLLRSAPSSPENQQAIEQINEEIGTLSRGFNFSTNSETKVTYFASEFKVVNASSKSDCLKGFVAAQSDNSNVYVLCAGNVYIQGTADSGSGSLCPAGDKSVWVFDRVN